MARVLIVIPTYNEAADIAALCEEILKRPEAVDVLVVDDNSPDGTAAEAGRLTVDYPGRMNVLLREGKGGRGGAVLAGLKWGLARGYDYLFEMDADFSHRPEEIPVFLAACDRADVVVGSRYLKASQIVNWPQTRRFFSKWANRYARFFLRIPISDYTNGFRCYRREAAAAINPELITARGYIVLSEIAYQLYKSGFRFADVPTVFVNRRRGESNLSPKEITSAFTSVVRLWWRGRKYGRRAVADSA